MATATAADTALVEAAADAAADSADSAAAAVESPARSRTQRRVAAIVVLALVVAGTAGGLVVSGLNRTPARAPPRRLFRAGAQQGTVTKATQAATPSPAARARKPTSRREAEASEGAGQKARVAAARIRSLPIKLAEAFGPDGAADGDNPQIAQFAITRDASLPWQNQWQSQWYVTPEFGMLKTGTGLLLDMGRRVTITSVALELGPYAGADLQLRAGNTATLPGLRVAARVNGAGSTLRLRLRSPRTARYLLIWFTLLPPNGAGQYQARVVPGRA